jgi:nucleoside-diphosphate-sugar epimerase
MNEDTRVIVLGASGFIGGWVSRAIPESARTFLVMRDLASAKSLKRTAIELDLLDSSELRQLFNDVRPSVIFNLAGYGVDPMERDEKLGEEINAELPRRICDALRNHSDSLLIHAGTALEYGIATGNLAEETEPQPTTWYGQTKLAGTKTILESSVRSIVARLFTVYGPGEHRGRLLPSLIEAAENKREIDLTAGIQKRDFTYVQDVADGLIRLAGLRHEQSTLVNLATGKLHTVREFVETAAHTLQIPQKLLHFGKLPTRESEMHHENVSTERLRNLIKWTPSTTIEVGIQKTVRSNES